MIFQLGEKTIESILAEIPYTIGRIAQINFDPKEQVYFILEILDQE